MLIYTCPKGQEREREREDSTMKQIKIVSIATFIATMIIVACAHFML